MEKYQLICKLDPTILNKSLKLIQYAIKVAISAFLNFNISVYTVKYW